MSSPVFPWTLFPHLSPVCKWIGEHSGPRSCVVSVHVPSPPPPPHPPRVHAVASNFNLTVQPTEAHPGLPTAKLTYEYLAKVPLYTLYGWRDYVYHSAARRTLQAARAGHLTLPPNFNTSLDGDILFNGDAVRVKFDLTEVVHHLRASHYVQPSIVVTAMWGHPDVLTALEGAGGELAVVLMTRFLTDVATVVRLAGMGDCFGPSTRDLGLTLLWDPVRRSAWHGYWHAHMLSCVRQIPVWNCVLAPPASIDGGNFLQSWLSMTVTPVLEALSWTTLTPAEITAATFKCYTPANMGHTGKTDLTSSFLARVPSALYELAGSDKEEEVADSRPFQVRGIFWPYRYNQTGQWRVQAGDLCFFSVLIQDIEPDTYFVQDVLFTVDTFVLPRAAAIVTTMEDFRSQHPWFARAPTSPSAVADSSAKYDAISLGFRNTVAPEFHTEVVDGVHSEVEDYHAQLIRQDVLRRMTQEELYPTAAVDVSEAVRVFTERVCVAVGLRARMVPTLLDMKRAHNFDVALRSCKNVASIALPALELAMSLFFLRGKEYEATSGGLSTYTLVDAC